MVRVAVCCFLFWQGFIKLCMALQQCGPRVTGKTLVGDWDGTFKVFIKWEGLSGFPFGEHPDLELYSLGPQEFGSSSSNSCRLSNAALASGIYLSTWCLLSQLAGWVPARPPHRSGTNSNWGAMELGVGTGPNVISDTCCSWVRSKVRGDGPKIFPGTCLFCWVSSLLQLQLQDSVGLLLFRLICAIFVKFWLSCNLQVSRP